MMDALVDIVVEYGHNYMNGNQIKYSANFRDSKQEIVGCNDYIQDFIDSKLTVTNDASDKIGKRDMYTAFHEMYPKKMLKEADIITSLKSKKIEYNFNVRNKQSIKGCFLGVRFKSAFDEDEEENDDVDDIDNVESVDVGEQCYKQDEIARLNEIIKQLQSKNDKLEIENQDLQKEIKCIQHVQIDILNKRYIPVKPRKNLFQMEPIQTESIPSESISQKEIETLYDLFN
jgi:hypothetical protein